jgi:hypothetical protein
MSDAITRLRQMHDDPYEFTPEAVAANAKEAADELERLRTALRTLRVALKVGMPEYGYDDWLEIIDNALTQPCPTDSQKGAI